MTNNSNKHKNDAEKRSVSAPAPLFEAADLIATKRRFSTFSEYVRDLIRKDVESAEKPEREAVAA